MISAHPLCWPEGWPRTPSYKRKQARFTSSDRRLSVSDGVGRVLAELDKLGHKLDDIVISTNIRTRLDGFPRSDQPNPTDPGVAAYWQKADGTNQRVIAIDAYDTVAGNFGGMALKDVQHGRLANMVTLNSDLTSLGSRRVNVVKIDVEGMEADVLFGATDRLLMDRPILYVENDRLDRSPHLIEIIWSLGYRCYWHLPPLYNPDNFYGEKEDVYPGIVSVNMLCIHESRDVRAEGSGLVLVEKSNEHPLVKS